MLGNNFVSQVGSHLKATRDSMFTMFPDKLPKQDPRAEDADQMISRDLNSLSLKEREEALFDLHGITDNSKEDSQSPITPMLKDMQRALDGRIPDKKAYDLAYEIDSDYVTNARFRILFLRADLWDPYKAAVRMVRHLEIKLDLFGKDLLCKDITQDDLDEGTLRCLYSGWVQELPVRDSAGRVVSMMFPQLRETDMTVECKVCFKFFFSFLLPPFNNNESVDVMGNINKDG